MFDHSLLKFSLFQADLSISLGNHFQPFNPNIAPWAIQAAQGVF
jgi:hypothetical protein